MDDVYWDIHRATSLAKDILIQMTTEPRRTVGVDPYEITKAAFEDAANGDMQKISGSVLDGMGVFCGR
jgi:hypothetical protein